MKLISICSDLVNGDVNYCPNCQSRLKRVYYYDYSNTRIQGIFYCSECKELFKVAKEECE